MKSALSRAFAVIGLLVFACGGAFAQVDDICADAGLTPSLDSPFAHVPYVYGRVILQGVDPTAKSPTVVVIISEGQQSSERQRLDRSGNFCFRRRGSNSVLIVEVDGVEAARRTLPASSGVQHREDFEIHTSRSQRSGPPSVVSAEYTHPTNPKTVEFYKKAVDAETNKDWPKAIEYLGQIVGTDAADFVAWAKLGSIYFEQQNLPEAEAAFRKSLEKRIDYTPAWIFMGQIRMAQKQYLAAIEILKHAASLDTKLARTFQLLGEAYLLSKQGTLGVAALNEAIRLDPRGMAECHLQIAHLYELAGAKQLAAKEYKLFLEKVPDHKDKKRLKKYIKDNPE
jgi:hypothetical protein